MQVLSRIFGKFLFQIFSCWQRPDNSIPMFNVCPHRPWSITTSQSSESVTESWNTDSITKCYTVHMRLKTQRTRVYFRKFCFSHHPRCFSSKLTIYFFLALHHHSFISSVWNYLKLDQLILTSLQYFSLDNDIKTIPKRSAILIFCYYLLRLEFISLGHDTFMKMEMHSFYIGSWLHIFLLRKVRKLFWLRDRSFLWITQ